MDKPFFTRREAGEKLADKLSAYANRADVRPGSIRKVCANAILHNSIRVQQVDKGGRTFEIVALAIYEC
jgi:hypothetical protein